MLLDAANKTIYDLKMQIKTGNVTDIAICDQMSSL